MYDELIRKLRELASIPAHCENVDSCDGCSKEDICLRFTNERIIETASEAADAIESTSKAYQMMAEAYEAEVTKPKWIPVTERLPEICERDVNGNITFSEMVWSCIDCGDGFYWQQTDQYTTNCGGGWLSEVPEDGFTPKVVAWMPLPEPYEVK